MAGTAGKNKIEVGFRLSLDDSGDTARDISSGIVPGSVNGGGLNYDQVDMTAVSDTVMSAYSGVANADVTLNIYLDDTATTGAFTVVKGIQGGNANKTLTMQWGSLGNAPDTGDPEFEGEYVCHGGNVSFDGGRAVMAVTLTPCPGQTAPDWGTVA